MEDDNEALNVMAGISSYLGAGLGDDDTTADQYGKRIRWGLDNHHNMTVQLCADIVERLSKTPNTTWGEIKAEILTLKLSNQTECSL